VLLQPTKPVILPRFQAISCRTYPLIIVIVADQKGEFSGRGVFASKDIPTNTIIEVSPVLVLDKNENEEHISKTELYHYT
jgi:hypothetical protein